MKKLKKEYYVIAILMILFIIFTMFVSKGSIDTLDELVFNNIIKIKRNGITRFLYLITNLVATSGILISMFIVAMIFLKNKHFSDFKYIIINVGSGVILMQIIKNIIKRSRPIWKWAVQSGFSYPSGHTISAFMLYGTLILLINKKIKGPIRVILTIIFITMIILAGLSRIYLGVHYLSDVLGSIILGSIILTISNMFMNEELSNDKNKVDKTIQTK